MQPRLRRLARAGTIALLLLGCAGISASGPVAATRPGGTARATAYALHPARGWHVAGHVTVQPAPNGDQLLTITVTGPDEEITQRLGWHVAALACGDWGPYPPKPPLYYPGTRIERSRVFYLLEDRFHLDSDRRSLRITAPPDWTAQPFSVAAFVNIRGTGQPVTCADLPALP